MEKAKINYKHILLGILFFVGILSFVDMGDRPEIVRTLAITFLIAFWWLTEALPIGMTSLLPIVLFPLFGVLNGKEVSGAYINYIIFLFIGGFIMALAIEKWDLHKRMALKILSIAGSSFFSLMFGFMLCSSFLSMWISNTAAAMMMIPIGISIASVLNKKYGEKTIEKFNTNLFLSIAYACSIGGVATLVGTPPNLSFLRISEILYPNIPEISFAQWMLAALPVTICMFLVTLAFLYLTGVPKQENRGGLDKNYFKKEYKALGKTTTEQKRVFYVFMLLVFLWLFRKELVLGSFCIPGWSQLFEKPGFINDGTVAIFIAFLLFIIPSSKKNTPLVTWEITKKIPWHVVFLLGGGFAIAKAFVSSGLSVYLGNQLTSLASFSDLGMITAVVTGVTFLTEFTSNTATTEILLPVISSVANIIKLNPLVLMLAVTFASSMAFMLPAATAPNALVFGTGKIKMWEMVKAGFFLNLIAIVVVVLVLLFWVTYVFQINFHTFPDWALVKK